MISAMGSDVATWHPRPPSYEMHGRTHGAGSSHLGNQLRGTTASERSSTSSDIPAHSGTATHTPRANLVRRRLDVVARPLLPAIRRPDRCVREDDPLVGHRGPYALRRALHDARPPGLVLVREPDELGLERAHPQLALGARLVELAEANGHVAADDDRTPARLDDDH